MNKEQLEDDKAYIQLFNQNTKLSKRVKELEEEIKKLQAFYDYWAELYGKGLEVANWHMNGDLEPFDDFFDSAEEWMEGEK